MNEIQKNPMVTREDVAQAAMQLIQPTVRCLTQGKARMIAGDGSAHYSEDVAGMEGYARVLWALVPMLVGRCPEAKPLWKLWKEGLINGTDPLCSEYWGDIRDFDQRMVEMAVIGTGLCLAPEYFWGELEEDEQKNLYSWLNQINQHDMPKNNWRFFRILVNLGFHAVGKPISQERMEEDLELMESHYVADGWYFDKETQRDYYTLWGFHFYSLLYAKVMRAEDPERCERFIERAKLIAPRFACWFDGEGRALPYGRSLTYRFAQSSFWAAMAFAEVTTEELGWGEIKGLLLRNLRAWMKLPIFDRDGVLTVGYGYPNLCVAEGYNAPGSPYWALKSFFVLALPKGHPFWQAEEMPYTPPERFLDEHVRLLLTRDVNNSQVIAYTAGNHAYEHMHEDEKYEKFAYSTHFGFSVVKEASTLQKGAYDSMLVVRRSAHDLWHARSGCKSFRLEEKRVVFTWSPLDEVNIQTYIMPHGMWHIRRHVIDTSVPLELAEGAFAVKKDWAGARPCDRIASVCLEDEEFAMAYGDAGTSAIYALYGYQGGEVLHVECNTNMMVPRTVIPTLHANIRPGRTILICAVWADTGNHPYYNVPEEVRRYAKFL